MSNAPSGLEGHDISRLVFEAQVAAVPDGLPSFPWESGIMRTIFGPSCPIEYPIWHQPSLLAAPRQEPPPPEPVKQTVGGKRKGGTLFEQCIFVRSRLDQGDEDDKLWGIALGKWVTIFALVNHEGPVGDQLQQSFWEEEAPTKEEIVRDVLGPRAPRTAIKRANTLLRCLRWHLDHTHRAWPWTVQSVANFAASLKGTKGEASAVQSLFEAVWFARHVLGIPFSYCILSDRRLQGRAKRLACEGDDLKQAVVLTVEQVCKLEKRVLDKDTCVIDKYLLGGILLGLYSRSRWSDLRFLQFIHLDKAEDGSGFVESRTRLHKTRHSRKAIRRAMPLVSPIMGLHDASWVDVWMQAGTELEVDWNQVPFGPLVRAPSKSGHLLDRRCSSAEASSILRAALDLDSTSGVSSHSLKATTLVWCGRRGFAERDSLLLGQHSTGQKSHAVYAREMLSAPLRLYCAMLCEVKQGTFRPDTTRSGWLDPTCGIKPASQDFHAGDVPSPQLSVPCEEVDERYEPSLPSADWGSGEVPSASVLQFSQASSFECVAEHEELEPPGVEDEWGHEDRDAPRGFLQRLDIVFGCERY